MLSTTDADVAASRLHGVRAAVRQPLERALDGALVSDADALMLLEVERAGRAQRRPRRRRARPHAAQGHRRHVLAQGLPADHQPLPRSLFVLHLPQRPGRRARVDDAPGGDPRRARATDARCGCIEALMCLGDKPELRVPRLPRTPCRARARRAPSATCAQACEIALDEGLLPHTNAGLMTRDEMAALQAAQRQHGPDARERQPAPARAAARPTTRARQGPGAAPGDDARRRRARHPVHHRHSARHRRDARRARRQPARDPRPAPRRTATSRKSSSRTSAPSRRPAWRRARSPRASRSPAPSPSRA